MTDADALEPQALRDVRFSITLRGYARDPVDRTLAAAADALERSLAQHAELQQQLETTLSEREELAGTIERALSEQRTLLETLENLRREHEQLRQEGEQAHAELIRQRELQGSLASALIDAERRAAEIRLQAQREAETILAEAQTRARDTEAEAELARERLLADARAIRGLLENALQSIDDPRLTHNHAPSPAVEKPTGEGETQQTT